MYDWFRTGVRERVIRFVVSSANCTLFPGRYSFPGRLRYGGDVFGRAKELLGSALRWASCLIVSSGVDVDVRLFF